MKKEITIKASKVIASAVRKEQIAAISASLKGKKLFSTKIELARKSLHEVKSLPI